MIALRMQAAVCVTISELFWCVVGAASAARVRPWPAHTVNSYLACCYVAVLPMLAAQA
jgi:hypothetical protein